ncbi:hypothetical protein A2U01_0037783, partial [Trifolium medium]|nr:hypothetical protein [Trifolium medium]
KPPVFVGGTEVIGGSETGAAC